LTVGRFRPIITGMRRSLFWIALVLLAVIAWAYATDRLGLVSDWLHSEPAKLMPVDRE